MTDETKVARFILTVRNELTGREQVVAYPESVSTGLDERRESQGHLDIGYGKGTYRAILWQRVFDD